MKTSRTYTHPKTFKRRRPTSTTITSSNTNDVWRSLHLFVVLVIMVDIAAALLPKDRNHGFLIPSQVLSQRKSPETTIETPTRRQHNPNSFNYNILIPSQVRLHSSPQQNDAATPAAAAGNTTKAYSPPSTPNNPEVSKRRRRRQRQIPNAKKKTNRKFGNLPDVYWRSMSIEDLRQHPKFQALPFPSTIRQLQKLEDIRQFRQDSWQWDAVHLGRCTTSQAVAALGFLEPEAGRVLGVPKSWQRGGLGAYMRLSQQPIRTLEEMNDVLIDNNIDRETKRPPTNLWGDSASGHFAARYSAIVTENEINNRKHVLRQYNFSNLNVRTMWGNAQEATALLTALNFFWRHDPDIQLKEVGMCGAGLTSIDGVDGLLLGATPDGLLVYPNGTVEALEVKNHCPFFPATGFKGRRRSSPASSRNEFFIRHFDFEQVSQGLQPHYIPQLMMEMLCVGPECQSAVMVRQSATTGALILRVRRNDQWIEEMLYWLHRFQSEYVCKQDPPPVNFFFDGKDSERYAQFLQDTNDLQATVEILEHVPHNQIQRAGGVRQNLFLD